jgi:hypothetical protein
VKYTMDRSGIGAMLRGHPGIKQVMRGSAQKVLRVAQSRVPVDTGALRASGRVEDLGIQGVFKGEPRMTLAVVFHSRYAMDIEARTGFLSGAAGKRKR